MRDHPTLTDHAPRSVWTPRIRRSGAYAACLLIGAAALASCSSTPHKGAVSLPSSTQPSSHSTTTTSTSHTSTTASGSKTSTSGAGSTGSVPAGHGTVPKGSLPINTTTTAPNPAVPMGAPCKKSQLSITQTSSNIKSSSLVGGFTIANTSANRCSLVGTATVLLIGKLGPLPTHVTDGGVTGQPALPSNQVTLAPKGGQASFLMSWSPTSTTSSCAEGTQIDFTLPNVTGSIFVPAFVTACGGNVNISPIQPNVVQPT